MKAVPACSAVVALALASAAAAPRSSSLFNDGWRIHLGEDIDWACSTASSVAEFPINITGSFIIGLNPTPTGAASPEACAATCNCTCQAWQYCATAPGAAPCTAPVAAVAAADGDCTNASFPVSYDNQECMGLNGAAASSLDECVAACCGDPTCEVYQWCPDGAACGPAGSCWIGSLAGGCKPGPGWQSSARALPPMPCWTGLLADYGPYNLDTSGSPGWVGGARLQPPSPASPQAYGPAAPGFDDSAWEPVTLPHDYLARSTPSAVNASHHVAEHGYIQFSNAWYRKSFSVPAGTQLARLYFDGAYRSAAVFLNGALAAQHEEGYTGFSVWLHNVTGAPLVLGGGANVLAVHLDATTYPYELWSYEGAGITRDVTLVLHSSPLSIAPWGVFAPATVTGAVSAPGGPSGPMTADSYVAPRVDVANAGAAAADYTVQCTVLAPDGVTAVATGNASGSLPAGGWARVQLPRLLLPGAMLWFPAAAPDAPPRPLYTLVTVLLPTGGGDGVALDALNASFGVRSAVFAADTGLAVNGFPVKVRGLSIHQDFGGTGTFVPPNAIAYRLQRLLDMGANGYRTAHNPVASAVLDEADRRGVLVWSENRFLRGFAQYRQDAQDMVLRDRNHPSIIMWSLCNENGCLEVEGQEGAPAGRVNGAVVGASFKAAIDAADGTRPVTANSHNTLGTPGTLLDALDVMGLTYDYGSYDPMHAAKPGVPLIGGESASCISQRGDAGAGSSYGALACTQAAWAAAAARPFVAGQFVWSGFDYGGEGQEFSSYGVMDACGFAKPVFGWYAAWWSAAAGAPGASSRLSAFPAWGNVGAAAAAGAANVTVVALSSAAAVSLAVNGVPVPGGRVPVPALTPVSWSVPYSPGNYTVTAYDAGGAELATFASRTPGPAAALVATLDWPGAGAGGALRGDGVDVALVRLALVDAAGTVLSDPAAAANVTIVVSGGGALLGLCNGDPRDALPRQGASFRPTYGGLVRAVVRSAAGATSAAVLTASAAGVAGAQIVIPVQPAVAPV